jgi:SAF domain
MTDRLPAPYVRLAEEDNVVVLIRHVEEGDVLDGLDGLPWTMPSHLEAGNKLAARQIAAGDRVLKYGVPIGTATEPITAGTHVHTHNLRSDWIPFDLEEDAHGDERTN